MHCRKPPGLLALILAATFVTRPGATQAAGADIAGDQDLSRMSLAIRQSLALGAAEAADDPHERFKLTSSMTLPRRVSVDATPRYVGALPDPALPGYWKLSSRIGWRVLSALEVSLGGSNLLHARHLELPVPYGECIARSVFARVDWSLR